MTYGRHRTYVGAVHVHTDQNGDESSLDDLVIQARDAGLDFIVITDRMTRNGGTELREGWHRGVLVIVGEEIITPSCHALAFETRETVGDRPTMDDARDAVRSQHGTLVSIHHQLPHLPIGPGLAPLAPLPLEHADILEVWSFLDEFLAKVTPKTLFSSLKRPERLLEGPARSLLSQWDAQLIHRMLPIVGGLNLHHRKHPLLDWREIIPPRIAFQTICTCIQTSELPTVAIRARDMVWSALREGRSYAVNRSVGPDRGFEFFHEGPGGRIRQMGDNHPYQGGGWLWVKLPEEAEIVIRQDGNPLFWGTGRQIRFPVVGPGAYRVEVRKDRRLWILSNPIRLLDEEGVIQPTVSDVT